MLCYLVHQAKDDLEQFFFGLDLAFTQCNIVGIYLERQSKALESLIVAHYATTDTDPALRKQ